MPRFYFHYWDGDVLTEDTQGSEHDDADSAFIEAFDTAEGLTIDLIRDHRSAVQGNIDVRDDLDRRVFGVPFSEVVGAKSASKGKGEMRARARTAAADVRRETVAAKAAMDDLAALIRQF